jgi:hypothetical protein
MTWVTETTVPSASVVSSALVTKEGADNVRRPTTISVTDTGVGKVESGVSITVLVIVVCVPWNVPEVPELNGVAIPRVKEVAVIGETLVGAQETSLSKPCPVEGGKPWDMDTWEVFEVEKALATAGHDEADFTVVTDLGETKDDCGNFLGVGEEASGTARGPEVTKTLERAVEWPDGL